jgi:hypothetical protein
VREGLLKLKECYDAGVKKDPNLTGDVKVRFVIDESGGVSSPTQDGSSLSEQVIRCVLDAFAALSTERRRHRGAELIVALAAYVAGNIAMSTNSEPLVAIRRKL